jgi:ABC-type transport system involved in multi-copper enzyme maturation permease subunit
MVVENLQITPLMEWLLGPGWTSGTLWHPWGMTLVIALLLVGGLALLRTLRQSTAPPGPETSLWIGGIFGALSLLALVAVALCSTAKTRNWLTTYIASPIFNLLVPLLGSNWTDGALYTWLSVAAALAGVVFACGWLIAVLVGGPLAGTRRSGRAVADLAIDLARTSPRRTYALARLAVRESLRRRVVVIFVVFVVMILFAALFIKKDSLHPGQLYIQVVLNFTIYLSMLFALVLSALSLPADIRDRTLHTVVTKPVRKIEIVLGRVLGFIFVGTLLLAGIGAISYGFTVRSLNHTHQLTADMLQAESLPGNRGTMLRGTTSMAHGHDHEVTIVERPGQPIEATVGMKKDHTHDLYVSGSGDKAIYTLGPPEGQLQARVPIYGKLSFRDDTGGTKARGINTGDEWTYRSFIRGRTAAAAIWTFDGLSKDLFPESKFPNGIPVEMTIEVFRTHKGNQEKGVAGTISLSNPQTGKKVLLENFLAQKFATDKHVIPFHFTRPAADGRAEQIDLFRDLVSDDGRLEITLQCLEDGMYFGMAQADMYIRAADSTFAWNFCKGYLGIWLQMALVICLGVFCSTFLSGPVALMLTMFVMIMGIFSGYIVEVASGKIVGGGPFESIERIMKQENMISALEPGMKTNVIKTMDEANAVAMRFFSAVVPNVSDNDYVDRVACGFDVGRELVARCLLCEAAYLLPVILLSFVCLKQREMAQ